MPARTQFSSHTRRESVRLIPSLLAVALDEPAARDAGEFHTTFAPSVPEALEYLSMLSFDLLIAGREPAGGGLESLAANLSQYKPQQRWAIVAHPITTAEERSLRELGGVGVFQDLFTCLAMTLPRAPTAIGLRAESLLVQPP